MLPLPPFIAKLVASDGYEEKKYFETKAAAEKWALGEGKDKFDGDIERAEIYHAQNGLVWFKDHPKVEEDWRIKQVRSDPNSLLWRHGWPKPKPKPDIEAYCGNCLRNTMFWPEEHEFFGYKSAKEIRCSECYKVRPADAPKS